jgi:hypothetical protein
MSTPLPIFTEQYEDFDPLPPLIADPPESTLEVRLSQLQKVSGQMNLPTISHLDISSLPRQQCIRGDLLVGRDWEVGMGWLSDDGS